MTKQPEELKDSELDQAGGKGERGEFIEIYNPTEHVPASPADQGQESLAANADPRRKRRKI